MATTASLVFEMLTASVAASSQSLSRTSTSLSSSSHLMSSTPVIDDVLSSVTQSSLFLSPSSRTSSMFTSSTPYSSFSSLTSSEEGSHSFASSFPSFTSDISNFSPSFLSSLSSASPTSTSPDTMVLNETIMSIMNQEAEAILGPQRDALTTVIPMTFVYTLIFITGLFGNLCTCIVIIRNKYMHTTVNFYLFSLAVSDLLLLIVGLPPELWGFWQKYPYVFGETFCIMRALTSECCSNASVLTITAFTIERYIAICHPLKAHTMAQLPRAVKAILVIWVVSAVSSVPIAFQLGIIYQVRSSGKQDVCARIEMIFYECHVMFITSFFLPFPVFLLLPTDLTNNTTGDAIDRTMCSQDTTSLRLLDLNLHLLRFAHDTHLDPLLPYRTSVKKEFPSNGKDINDTLHFSFCQHQQSSHPSSKQSTPSSQPSESRLRIILFP